MSKGLTPKEKELYRRVDEVLYYIWDPVGISTAPSARDEYYSYLPCIFTLVLKAESDEEIIEKLNEIEITMMLSKPSEIRNKEVANLLMAHREEILGY